MKTNKVFEIVSRQPIKGAEKSAYYEFLRDILFLRRVIKGVDLLEWNAVKKNKELVLTSFDRFVFPQWKDARGMLNGLLMMVDGTEPRIEEFMKVNGDELVVNIGAVNSLYNTRIKRVVYEI